MLLLGCAPKAKVRGVAPQPPRPGFIYNSFWYLLHETEKARYTEYMKQWYAKRGVHGEEDPDCVVHLGDNPVCRAVWSANGAFPSFRTGMSMLYHPYSQTVVLAKEKLCLLGWPLYQALAEAAGPLRSGSATCDPARQ